MVFDCFKTILLTFEDKFSTKAGMIYILVQSFCFSCGGVFIKRMHNISVPQILIFRQLLMTIITGKIIEKFNLDINPSNKEIWLTLLGRGILGSIGILSNFYAVRYTTLLEVNCIMNLSPVVIGILGWVILKENYTRIEFICAGISFTGFLFMIEKPEFIFNFIKTHLLSQEMDQSATSTTYKQTRFLGVILSLVAMCVYSTVTIIIRRKKTGVNTFVYLQYFNICSQLINPLMLIEESKVGIPNLQEVLFLCILTIFAFVGQLSRTRGVQLDKAGKVSIFNYSRIVFSYLFDIFIFNETPNALSTTGAFLIFFPAFIIFYSGKKIAD